MGQDLGLPAAIRVWKPAPIQTMGTLSVWQVAAFTGLLDQPEAPREGDPLPPLWHWSATVKSGRSVEMVFVTVKHEFHQVDGGQVLVTEEQDIVYRSQPPGQTRSPTTDDPALPEPSPQ